MIAVHNFDIHESLGRIALKTKQRMALKTKRITTNSIIFEKHQNRDVTH